MLLDSFKFEQFTFIRVHKIKVLFLFVFYILSIATQCARKTGRRRRRRRRLKRNQLNWIFSTGTTTHRTNWCWKESTKYGIFPVWHGARFTTATIIITTTINWHLCNRDEHYVNLLLTDANPRLIKQICVMN